MSLLSHESTRPIIECLISLARESPLLRSGDVDTRAAWQVKANLRFIDVFRAENGSDVLSPDIGSWKKNIGQRPGYSGAKLMKSAEQAGAQTLSVVLIGADSVSTDTVFPGYE